MGPQRPCRELGGERYGLDIGSVYEILPIQPITSVPAAPEFVEGVINLEGSPSSTRTS